MDADRLTSSPLFEGLSKKEREHVARQADEVDVPAGKVLAQQGELGWEFFVIETGAAEVLVDGEKVAELGPGDFFGELALLGNRDRYRTATVTATDPSTLIVMTRQAFDDFRREAPEAAKRIEEAAQAR